MYTSTHSPKYWGLKSDEVILNTGGVKKLAIFNHLHTSEANIPYVHGS